MVLDDLKLLHERDPQDLLGAIERQLAEQGLVGGTLQASVASWTAITPTKRNLAKQIAQECLGVSMVIYAGPVLTPAAQAWKHGFNVRARQLAWTAEVSAAHDDELLGWTKQPIDKPYGVIDLRSSLDDAAVQRRFVAAERLLSGLRPAPIIVEAEGNDLAAQLQWTITLGDFVTVYLALLTNVAAASTDFLSKYQQLSDQ
jgi:hypothetical protein